MTNPTPAEPQRARVLPLAAYAAVFAVLLVLTAATVAFSFGDFGMLNPLFAFGVATVMAAAVALVFMHLALDRAVNAAVLVVAAACVGALLVLISFDATNRGAAEAIEAEQPSDIASPFAGTRSEKALQEAAAKR